MDKTAIIEITNQFMQGMEARGIKPQKLVLFGSHADGTSREGSDIDIAIISDDFIGLDYWERIDILSEIIYEIFAPIEAIALTQKEWEQGDSIVADFARAGEVLFAA